MNLLPVILPKDIKYTNGTLSCTILFRTSLNLAGRFWIDMLDETGFLIIGTIITVTCYVQTLKIQKENPLYRILRHKMNLRKMFWYPAILLVLFLTGVIDRMTRVFTEKPIFPIQIIYLIGTHSAGGINALLYALIYEYHKRLDSNHDPETPNQPINNTIDQTHLIDF